MPPLALEHEAGRGWLTEAALFPGEAHFRRLLENLPAGAYTCDPDGLITYFNQHAVQLWGRAPKLNDPVDRFCGSFKLFTTDGSPVAHEHCWMGLALRQTGMTSSANRRRERSVCSWVSVPKQKEPTK